MRKPHSVDFSHTSSELCHQAFIDTMEMFNNSLSYKELIRSVVYVHFFVLLTETDTIVISGHMENYGIPQRPQVRGLSPFYFLPNNLDPLYSYQPRTK